MNTPKKYIVDMGWQVLLNDLHLSAHAVLSHARLPLDLLSRKAPALTAEEYFRLWDSLMYLFHDELFPLRLGQSVSVEAFSPPIFACFCSPNLTVAFKRLAQYKPIVAPLHLTVQSTAQFTAIGMNSLPNLPAPQSLLTMELVFMLHLVRLATREQIIPQAVELCALPPQADLYTAFFGVPITIGAQNALYFSPQDATRPFLTANDGMWAIFESELITRMKDLRPESDFRERVRACLIEILASGEYSMADVAKRLAISPRTLQRRLQDENTTFQQELDNLREELARHYLKKSDYTSGQIAFLLGYEDPNSFFRAFRTWTGTTPDVVRALV